MEPYTKYNLDVIVKTCFKRLVEAGLIEKNPIENVRLTKPCRPKHPAPTLSDVNVILDEADGVTFVVIAIAAFAGLRVGEIQNLSPCDVDLDAGVIHVREGKTEAAAREVPIHPRLAAILHGYDGFDGVYLLNAPASNRYPDGNHHINPRTINVVFKDLAKQAGLDVGRKDQGMTFHALRRFFKSACYDAGVPQPLVDRWVGHSTKNDINHHYYRPTRSSSAEWMSRVDFGENTQH